MERAPTLKSINLTVSISTQTALCVESGTRTSPATVVCRRVVAHDAHFVSLRRGSALPTPEVLFTSMKFCREADSYGSCWLECCV